MMKCASCGKRYDYLKEESCPHCGAYNAPSDGRTHACTSYELDHQGEEAPRHQLPTQTQGESSWKKGAGSSSYAGWKFSSPSAGHSTGGSRQRTWGESDPASRSTHRRLWPAVLIFLMVLGFLLTFLISNLAGSVLPATPEPRPHSEEAAVSVPYSENEQMGIYPIHIYTPGEEISISGLTVKTADPRYADWFLSDKQPMSLVIFPLSLTVADQNQALRACAPHAYLYYNPDSDEFVSPLTYDDFPQLFEELGVTSLNFEDAVFGQSGAEQEGALFFMVPGQWTPGSLRLVLDEYGDGGDYTLAGVHEVVFEITEENRLAFPDDPNSYL